MGGFTSKNLPRPEFCGGWADGKGTYMTISPTGAIKYVKSTPNSSDSINGYGEYDQYGFDVTFCCTPSLEGNYQNFNGRQAVFIVNGDTLIKQKPGVVEGIIGNMAAQSVNGDIGMGAMASAGVGSMSFG